MSTITKAHLVDEIAQSTGLTKTETKAVVNGVLSNIITAIADGQRIELRGFGVFKSKERKPRPARNPKTGEIVQLKKRFVPMFKPSPDLFIKVNDTMKNNEK